MGWYELVWVGEGWYGFLWVGQGWSGLVRVGMGNESGCKDVDVDEME